MEIPVEILDMASGKVSKVEGSDGVLMRGCGPHRVRNLGKTSVKVYFGAVLVGEVPAETQTIFAE